jgi:hypothetical protein
MTKMRKWGIILSFTLLSCFINYSPDLWEIVKSIE